MTIIFKNNSFLFFGALVMLILRPNFTRGTILDSTEIDQLMRMSNQQDTIAINAMYKLTDHFILKNDTFNANLFNNRQVYLSEKLNNSKGLVKAYNYKARISHWHTGDSTLFYTNAIIQLLEEDTSDFAIKYRLLAYHRQSRHYQFKKKDIATAYNICQIMLQLSTNFENKQSYFDAVFALANMLKSEKKYSEVIQLIDEAYINTECFTGKPLSEITSLLIEQLRTNSYCIIEDNIENYEQAFDVYRRLLAHYTKAQNDRRVITTVTALLAKFINDAPLDTLAHYANIAYVLEKKQNIAKPKFYYCYGKILYKQNKHTGALYFLNIALKKAIENKRDYKTILHILNQKMVLNKKFGETAELYENHLLYIVYTDSLSQYTKENALDKIKAKFKLANIETENDVLKIKTETLENQHRFALILSLLLLCTLFTILISYIKLKQKTKQLKILDDTKNKVFTILAHDLKEPSIAFHKLSLRLSYLIKKGDQDQLLKMAKTYEQNGEALKDTIHSVVNWAISAKDNYSNKSVYLKISPLIKESISQFDRLTIAKNIKTQIEIDNEDTIYFDKGAFDIINRNIIHNAIKFSPVNSTISIIYIKENNTLKYVDEGNGMDKKTIEKVLNTIPVESKEGTIKEKGTGIGLATCVELVRKNNSEITIKNKKHRGLEISLHFPDPSRQKG